MVDDHNKAVNEILSQIHNDELRKYLKDFHSLNTSRIMNHLLKADNEFHEIAQKYEAQESIFLERKNDSSDTYLIDLLTLQIDNLKAVNKCQVLEINLLKLQIETIENTKELSELADAFNEKAFDMQEGMIKYQTTKIDKYKKGPKKKSSDSQQKWALANDYFIKEIPLHRTLKAARLTAAKRAGIVAEERQLNKMMPNPQQ